MLIEAVIDALFLFLLLFLFFSPVLPDSCSTYDGPHSYDCLLAVWNKAGCTEEGLEDIYHEMLNTTLLG